MRWMRLIDVWIVRKSLFIENFGLPPSSRPLGRGCALG